jgi:hypothetical protein
MTIEIVRDLVVIIFGAIGTIFLITLLVLTFSLYRRIKVIQTSISETAVQLPKLIAESRESLKAIAQIVSIISAVGMGIDLIRKIFEMKIGGKASEQ